MPSLEPPEARFDGLDAVAFRKRGYNVVRRLLQAQEVQDLRRTAQETVDRAERDGRAEISTSSEGTIRTCPGDLLSMPSLRHVLLDQRMLEVVRELLGGEPVYFGDSSLRIGKNGQRAWHRDNVNRRRWRGGPDWQEAYPILRCGLYLQDQARHSGGLALRPCSNRPGFVRPTLPMFVNAQAGDLVVWELKTVHSGEVVRLRWLPQLPLHPRVQTWLPESMRAPEDDERIVLFMTFGRAGAHLDRYIEYLRGRDYMQEAWASSRFGPDAMQEAEQAGLCVILPVATYGVPA
jgi:Phytanoyl-CoA dioxygenase (PhyH)